MNKQGKKYSKAGSTAAIWLLILGCILLPGPAVAQEATDGAYPSIKWVSQYPDSQATVQTPNFFRNLRDLVLGKSKRLRLVKPMAVIATSTKNMTVLDQGVRNVLRLGRKKVSLLPATKNKSEAYTSLVGMCYAANGSDFFFTDSRLNKVYKVTQGGEKIVAFADTFHFHQPTGVAVNSVTGEVWVVETAEHRVDIFNDSGRLVKSIGTRGNDPGQFNFPTSIWIGADGVACIVDAMNFRVALFDAEGNYRATFGELGDGSGYLARPKGIAEDTYGHIYVVDGQFHVVQVFDRTGKFLYRFGGQGTGVGEFWMPAGIFIDAHNTIYVADTYNSRIQVFQLINGS